MSERLGRYPLAAAALVPASLRLTTTIPHERIAFTAEELALLRRLDPDHEETPPCYLDECGERATVALVCHLCGTRRPLCEAHGREAAFELTAYAAKPMTCFDCGGSGPLAWLVRLVPLGGR